MKIKSYMAIFFILFLSMISICGAEWDTKQADDGRTGVITGTASFNTESGTMTSSFTCGTGSGDEDIQPLFMDINDDTYNEMVTVCSGDGEGATRIKIMDNSLSELDYEILSGEWGAVSGSDVYPFEVEDIDNDGNLEIIYYHPEDYTTDHNLELIVYEYNISSENIIKEYSYPFQNNTPVWNDTINLTDFVSYSNGTHLECLSEMCYVQHDSYMMALNMTSKSKAWLINSSDINPDFDITQTISANSGSKFYPVFKDINLDGIIEVCMTSGGGGVVCLNEYDGSVTHNYTLQITGDDRAFQWFFTFCSASRCENDREMIVVSSVDTGDDLAYCDMYDSNDGGKVQTTATEDMGVTTISDSVACWVEDRDDDGNDELCIIGLSKYSFFYSQKSNAKCEELNFFETDTLRTDLNYTDNESYQWINHDSQMNIVDYDQDGIMEVITDSALFDFNETFDGLTMSEADYLNESILVTGIESTIIAIDFISSGLLNIFSIPLDIDSDTYYVTYSTLTNFKAQFDNPPTQNIQNPVCNNSLLTYTCSYANGCISDVETDTFKMSIDCFSDGSQVWTDTRFTNIGLQDITGCDLGATNLTGNINTTFTLWDSEHDPSQNETIIVTFFKDTDDVGCFNNTNPGNVTITTVNTIPEFVGFPIADAPQPFCLDSGVTYTCAEGDCYTDDDDDEVYFKIDCDNDGTYETFTFTGDHNFYCRYTQSGATQLNVAVCDNFHATCDETSLSVVISTRTVDDVIADGSLDCGSSYLVDMDENGTIIPNLPAEEFRPIFTAGIDTTENIGVKDFCIGSTIDFDCDYGYCYWMISEVVPTVMDIDCENDGIIDYTSFDTVDHSFNCLFNYDNSGNATYNNVTELYTYTINLTLTNQIGQQANLLTNFSVSNNTFYCEFGIDVGEGCDNDTECNTGKCSYGFCALKNRGEYCMLNKQCLSGECSNNKCTRPDLMTQVSSAKDEQFGDSEDTNNLISLMIMLVITGAIIIGGGCLVGVIAGILAFVSLGVFFAMIGWLSGFILLAIFIVLLIGMMLAVIIGSGGG